MYIIKQNDVMVSSGQTRAQVLRALVYYNLMDNRDKLPPLPKFNKVLHYCPPLCDMRGSFTIEHI